jgi:hypothetical protein
VYVVHSEVEALTVRFYRHHHSFFYELLDI